MSETPSTSSPIRRQIRVTGVVQGVGFRPWIYRLARSLGLAGHVLNDSRGVLIEVEGPREMVERFEAAVTPGDPVHGESSCPPLARITSVAAIDIEPAGEMDFVIRSSDASAAATTQVAPDMAICEDCLGELFDPADRRHHYPFINCTNCGPRYSIILDVPYDRPATTMAGFEMCPACRREYEDPENRRFHAQPNACPVCGPSLSLHDGEGREVACDDAVAFVRDRLRAGDVVVIKGLTGYHLACDAASEAAVAKLRARKRRDEKPLALMVGDVAAAERLVHLDEASRGLLESPERPIVLIPRCIDAEVVDGVAPRSLYLGLMLPYAPLHFVLFRGGAEPLGPMVMTSANLSEEPMCRENAETLARMSGIADWYLLNDRPIQTLCDDSVATIQRGEPLVIRRARGYAPRPMPLMEPAPAGPILAVGPELKNCVALTRGAEVYVSQHIGDLKNPLAITYFEETVEKLARLLEVRPAVVAHDLHPAYHSTRYARRLKDVRHVAVQHHHAHIASVMAEHGLAEAVVGVAMDGTGYGEDGHTWGSEFLHVRPDGTFARLGHLRYIALPGGDAAVENPVRIAYAWLLETFGEAADEVAEELLPTAGAEERGIWRQMIARGVNAPQACGLGRLFDAASALLGVCTHTAYEGQAAIELEAAAASGVDECFEVEIGPEGESGGFVIDPRPMIRGLVEGRRAGRPAGELAAVAQNSMVTFLLDGIGHCRRITGLDIIGLAGGCFLNRYLVEHLMPEAEARGARVYRHREVSPGDGGVALGQVEVARQRLAAESR